MMLIIFHYHNQVSILAAVWRNQQVVTQFYVQPHGPQVHPYSICCLKCYQISSTNFTPWASVWFCDERCNCSVHGISPELNDNLTRQAAASPFLLISLHERRQKLMNNFQKLKHKLHCNTFRMLVMLWIVFVCFHQSTSSMKYPNRWTNDNKHRLQVTSAGAVPTRFMDTPILTSVQQPSHIPYSSLDSKYS